MKKSAFFLMMMVFVLFYTACKDDENNTPDPPPVVSSYSVSYTMSVFGAYDSLEISYYEADNVKRYVSGPKTPWEKYMNDFVKIDSVALRASFMPKANRTVTYEYEVRITKGSEFINGSSGSETLTSGDNPQAIYIDWAVIVE